MQNPYFVNLFVMIVIYLFGLAVSVLLAFCYMQKLIVINQLGTVSIWNSRG